MPEERAHPTDDFLVFGAPTIGDAEIAEAVDSLHSGWIGTGPKVARFEDAFARYKHTDHAVAVSSCTAALHLSLLALELPPGSEVITSALTFCATANAIIHAGATPILADIDPDSQNLDPASVEAAITPNTRAIIPVHLAGRPCAMESLLDLADRHDLAVVEDCAHAIEAEFRGRPCGTLGRFGCFSFYATKNVTTGEGGMILCERPEDADRLKSMALHGLSGSAWRRFHDEGYQHYLVSALGFKYNLTDLQAAIGLHQLERVEVNYARRLAIWNQYLAAFADLPVALPAPLPGSDRHALHLFTLLIDEAAAGVRRDEFLDRMTRERIGVGVHYLSLPEHPYYQERFGWSPHRWPVAERIGRQTVSLPLSPGLTDADVERVIAGVRTSLDT